MEEFWVLIMVAFILTNSLDKAESVKVKLEETPLKTFDEIFGEDWWDKSEAEDLKAPPINFGENVHHQIDRQNTQIGPNSTDQNLSLTESDHSDSAKNGNEQSEIMNEITSIENIIEDEQKRKIIDKFHAIRDELQQKGKFPWKERIQIEKEIAKHLKVYRSKIYKWKKEFGLSRKMFNEKEERKHLVDKFEQKKAELKRDGFKNSQNELDKTVAKELGLSFSTIYNWKRELCQIKLNHIYSHSEQKELMKRYYAFKDQTPKISDEKIAKMLNIGIATLYRWKSQFKRQKF